MFLLRNGSLASNCLLILSGAALGSVLTGWYVKSMQPPVPQGVGSSFKILDSKKSNTASTATNPALMLSQVLTGSGASHRLDDLRRLGSDTADQNRSQAISLAGTITNAEERAAYFKGLMESWASKDPAGAANYAKTKLAPGQIQSTALSTALGKWGGSNPREAYSWAEANLTGPIKAEGIYSLVQSWTRRAPQDVAKWYGETGFTSGPLLSTIAGTWANQAPEDAAKWAGALPEPDRKIAEPNIVKEWVQTAPEKAVDYYKDKPELGPTIADIWGTTDPQATSKWIAKLGDTELAREAASTLVNVWATKDINAAVDWSTKLPLSMQGPVVEQLATTWGALDPDTAIGWVQTLPENFQKNAATGTYNSWAATDPVGLQDWLNHNSAGKFTDVAHSSLGDVYSDSQPMRAISQALSLSTPQAQADQAARYYRNWQRKDAASAKDWLSTEFNSLPPAVQTSIAKEVKNQPR